MKRRRPGCLNRVRSPENRVVESEKEVQQLLFVVVQSSCINQRVVAECGRQPARVGFQACRGAAHDLLGQARGESGERGPSGMEGCRCPCFLSPTSGPEVQYQHTDSVNALLAWLSWLLSSHWKSCVLFANPVASLCSQDPRARAADEQWQWTMNKEQ